MKFLLASAFPHFGVVNESSFVKRGFFNDILSKISCHSNNRIVYLCLQKYENMHLINSRNIIGALGLIMLVFVGIILVLFQNNSTNKHEAETAKLKADSLMAIQQNLEREIFLLTRKSKSLNDRVIFLNDLVDKSNLKDKKREMERELLKRESK